MSESKVVKQISSLVLVLITLIGNIISIPVSAVSGDKAKISFEYCYNEYGDTIQLQKTTYLTIPNAVRNDTKNVCNSKLHKYKTTFSKN